MDELIIFEDEGDLVFSSSSDDGDGWGGFLGEPPSLDSPPPFGVGEPGLWDDGWGSLDSGDWF